MRGPDEEDEDDDVSEEDQIRMRLLFANGA